MAIQLLAVLLATGLILPARAADSAPARLIGAYSDMKTEGTQDLHFISGYNITLYQGETGTLGHVMVAIGSPDPASATISKLTFNPETKRLTFRAKYSEGLETSPVKGASDREAFKILTFSGVVQPKSISCKMGVKDFYCSTCRPVVQRVELKRIDEMGRTGALRTLPP